MMSKTPVAGSSARRYLSRLWRKPTIFWLLACLIFLLVLPYPKVCAQTSITGAQIRNPITPVAALPATCNPYSTYFLTTTNTPYICTATNTFTPLGTGAGGQSGLPSQTGAAGYLYTNGTTVSWANLITGGSGAIDCASTPGQCDITSIVPLKGAANTWTGANDFHTALLRIPESSVSALPAASANLGREFMVTDGASSCDTTIGGGSTRVLVESNGTSYVAPNCSTGGGGGGGQTASGPGWLFGLPSGGYGTSGVTFPVSGSNLTMLVWPIENPYTALKVSTLSFYLYYGDSGKYMAAAFYDNAGNQVCQSNSISVTTAGYLDITWPSQCSFTTSSGWFGLASNSSVITYMTADLAGVGFFEAIANHTSATVGSASNYATISGSTITMPTALGSISAVNLFFPLMYRRP